MSPYNAPFPLPLLCGLRATFLLLCGLLTWYYSMENGQSQSSMVYHTRRKNQAALLFTPCQKRHAVNSEAPLPNFYRKSHGRFPAPPSEDGDLVKSDVRRNCKSSLSLRSSSLIFREYICLLHQFRKMFQVIFHGLCVFLMRARFQPES